MNNKHQVNVAILGAGYMGQNHARTLSSMQGVNLVAICDLDESKTRKIAKQYKIKRYKIIQDLLDNERLDVVSICLPTSLHYEAGLKAIHKKLAVFIEKPIAVNVSQAKHLIRESLKNKGRLMIGHIERFNPVVNEIKNRIKSGEIGNIIEVHTQRFSPPPGRAKDVSAIIDLATHDIDILQYLINSRPKRIYAEADKRFHTKEDFMSSFIRYENGVIGHIEVSWLHPHKVRNLSVLGTKGMYTANYITQELLFYKQNTKLFVNNTFPMAEYKSDVVKVAFESREPLEIELQSFIESCIRGVKMAVTGFDGLVALETAMKITESSQKHKVIK